jgi:hypothetical protein
LSAASLPQIHAAGDPKQVGRGEEQRLYFRDVVIVLRHDEALKGRPNLVLRRSVRGAEKRDRQQ